MKSYDEVELIMYQDSKYCRSRGQKKDIIQMFPFKEDGQNMIVGILRQSPLVGKGTGRYYYIMYNVAEEQIVDENTAEYRRWIEKLPSLQNMNTVYSPTTDVIEMLALQEKMKDAVSNYVQTGEFSENNMEICSILSGMMSEPMKNVYDFFLDGYASYLQLNDQK
ncbi:MAG: hypothetical protein LUG54_04210 [Clostridiales bacterium]|nr:hypothetical protein [Clostridiales bacterium]